MSTDTTTHAAEIRETARDVMRRRTRATDGTLRAACDLADMIRAHADPLQFLASLWDATDCGDIAATITLGKATKVISLGLRNPKALSATKLPEAV